MFAPADKDDKTVQLNHLSALIPVAFEPVGRWFESYIKSQSYEPSVSITTDGNASDEDDSREISSEISEEEKEFMLGLDPAEWQKQDHYRVLSIGELRFDATEEEIRKAYRRKVLKFHPDKKVSHDHIPKGLNEHAYFTCLTKAYEILSNPNTRRAYDSVDPSFDDSVPVISSSNKDNFFKVFGEKFTANERWSTKHPIPALGDKDTKFEDVDNFYRFWYNFDSWREFSYLDEEDKDKAESRDERRWMEKVNRQTRQRRKKEEIVRIRSLVDNAYACDPRVKKFKEEEKKRRQEEKKAKEEAMKEKEKQRKEAEENERKRREMEEQEAKEKAAKERKEKEKMKKILTRERKSIRQHMKEKNYYKGAGESIATDMEKLEFLLINLNLESLQELREASEPGSTIDFQELYNRKLRETEEVQRRAEEEKQRKLDDLRASGSGLIESNKPWSTDEIQLLVKATTLFPVGTASRWQVIANYVNEHSPECRNRTQKQVINQVKEMQKLDPSVKEEVNKKAFEKLEKSTASRKVKADSGPTVRDQASEDQSDSPWSTDEQRLLEQALKTYPANTPERWDRIAECVPTRTKKECVRRFKELVEMVKAKKMAQASVQKKK